MRFRPVFRRLALSLAAAQLLAYGAAPVIEASTEHATSQFSIEAHHSKTCVPVHQAATCMACQMLTITAVKGQSAALPGIDAHEFAFRHLADSIAPRAPPQGPLTRAPPLLG